MWIKAAIVVVVPIIVRVVARVIIVEVMPVLAVVVKIDDHDFEVEI